MGKKIEQILYQRRHIESSKLVKGCSLSLVISKLQSNITRYPWCANQKVLKEQEEEEGGETSLVPSADEDVELWKLPGTAWGNAKW